jgi:hypothetical protein
MIGALATKKKGFSSKIVDAQHIDVESHTLKHRGQLINLLNKLSFCILRKAG